MCTTFHNIRAVRTRGVIRLSIGLAEQKSMVTEREFDKWEDDRVIFAVRSGNTLALEHLLSKYRHFVQAKARAYFLAGGDYEDIVQEGMIGLYKAVRDFNGDKLSSFKAFAELCIKRQIITAIKSATRQKHVPLNTYVSLDKPLYEEESERTLLDIVCDQEMINPEALIINKEELDYIEKKMGEILSELERQVLTLYLEGWTYQEISANLNRRVKSIDNALQRIKQKLGRYVELKKVVF